MPVFMNYYPDRLGLMFIVNPNLLMKIGWATLKPFLDKVTIKKVRFNINYYVIYIRWNF